MPRTCTRWRLALLVLPVLLAGGACALQADRAFGLRRVAVDPDGGGDAAISPDGRRFVISSRRTGNWELWVYEIGRGTWTQLTFDPADDFEAQWSPDGTALAFTSTRTGNKDVWTLSLADGALRRLTTSAEDDEYPTWSPDGRLIAYTTGPWKRRVFNVVPAGGGRPRQISPWPHHAGACAFHPDGRSLVCHGYDSGSGDVFQLSLDGAMAPLTRGEGSDYKPSMMPGAGWLAFSRADEGPSHIVMKPPDGGEEVALTSGDGDDRWPTWTASGTELLFHRLVDDGVAVRALDRRTGAVTEIAGAGERPRQASFDPSATRVVYAVRDGGRERLRVREIGGPARALDTGPAAASFPRWSPDGRRIAYVERTNHRWEVATIDPDGRNRRVWTAGTPGLHGLYGPLDWSPDSTRLVFQTHTRAFEADLVVLDTRDGSMRRLTEDEWFDEAPAWTSDGRGVLFMSTRGGGWTWGLFRIGIDGGEPVPMADPDYVEKNYPRAGPGGLAIWSALDERGREQLVEGAADGMVRPLAAGDGHMRWASYSADGRYVLFTALRRQVEYWVAEHVLGRGSPLLVRPTPARTSEAASCAGPRPSLARAPLTASLAGVSPVALHRR